MYPRDYAHLIRDAIVQWNPSLASFVLEQPLEGDFTSELRLEVPSQNRSVPQPLVVSTYHSADGSKPPGTELGWFDGWSTDRLLVDEDIPYHVESVVQVLRAILDEEIAPFRGLRKGQHTCGGALVPPDGEPFPFSRVDRIIVRSWRGTYDRDLTGDWPGWPNDPKDPFYKSLR